MAKNTITHVADKLAARPSRRAFLKLTAKTTGALAAVGVAGSRLYQKAAAGPYCSSDGFCHLAFPTVTLNTIARPAKPTRGIGPAAAIPVSGSAWSVTTPGARWRGRHVRRVAAGRATVDDRCLLIRVSQSGAGDAAGSPLHDKALLTQRRPAGRAGCEFACGALTRKDSMREIARYRTGLVALGVVLALGAAVVLTAAAPAGTPQAASPPVSCTIWRAANGSLAGPADCTFSNPWWQSWSDCPITPVHGERWLPDGADWGLLSDLPWVQAGPGIVGHLFYGNRPLPVGGKFPDGSATKVLWHFTDMVEGLRMTATNLGAKQQAPIDITSSTGPANSAPFSTEWPSYVVIPQAGCWRVDLSAKDEDGHPVKGSVTFIVVK